MAKPDLNSKQLPTPAGSQAAHLPSVQPLKLAVICLGLVVLVVWAFWPSVSNDFVNLDDPMYVSGNVHVLGGLTWPGIGWAFANLDGGFWHPLTWLSLMLDCQMFGLRAGGHHLVSLLLHATTTLVLFLAFRRLTGATWRSVAIAVLFALHPLHVESVAWVSDRKDVLAALFWMLALLMYAHYAQKPKAKSPASAGENQKSVFHLPSSGFYFLSLLFFACGLMSKATVLTLPFILLLLDWWPLRRFQRSTLNPEPSPAWQSLTLLLEKLPFLAAGVLAGLVSAYGQKHLGALPGVAQFPVGDRIANATLSFVRYLAQTFWPVDLAAYYPYPRAFPPWPVVGAALLGVIVSVLLLWGGRKRPYLAVGWLWYVVTLLPAIQLIQIGGQSRADRYTYVPLIGLFLLLVWGICDLTRRWRYQAISLSAAAILAVSLCLVLTRRQLGYWRDSETLFRHALAVTRDNSLAQGNLGVALMRQGRFDEAVSHLQEAVRLQPDDAYAHYNLGNALGRKGLSNEAIIEFQESIRLKPDSADAHNNLGNILLQKGRVDEAIVHFETALEIRPAFADAHNDLGGAFLQRGQLDEAAAQFRKALELNPGDALVLYNLGSALLKSGRVDQALAPFQQALDIRPDFAEAHSKLGIVLLQTGQVDEAIMHFQRALAIRPGLAEAHYNLGKALFKKGREDEAMVHFQRAVQLNPNLANVHSDLGSLLLQKGRVNEALTHYEAALELQPGNAYFLNNLAWVLATCPNPEVRNGARAVELAQKAERLSGGNSSAIVGTLAAAYAEAGRFGEAVKAAQRALDLATAQTNTAQADMIRANIALFRAGSPFHEAGPANGSYDINPP